MQKTMDYSNGFSAFLRLIGTSEQWDSCNIASSISSSKDMKTSLLGGSNNVDLPIIPVCEACGEGTPGAEAGSLIKMVVTFEKNKGVLEYANAQTGKVIETQEFEVTNSQIKTLQEGYYMFQLRDCAQENTQATLERIEAQNTVNIKCNKGTGYKQPVDEQFGITVADATVRQFCALADEIDSRLVLAKSEIERRIKFVE